MLAPAKRLATWATTRDAISMDFDPNGGLLASVRGHDIRRFRCAGCRFVSFTDPNHVDRAFHRSWLKFVEANEYDATWAAAGVNPMTDEGDSWSVHRTTLNPTFARCHLNEVGNLMLDPIERITADVVPGTTFARARRS
jgi:cytochrome P450